MNRFKTTLLLICFLVLPGGALPAFASGGEGSAFVNLTHSVPGIVALLLFIAAYALVMFEEKLHMRKSKPVILAAGFIWGLVAIAYSRMGDTHTAHEAIQHNLIEYAELFLFLLAAMTYINAMEERNVFQTLRCWLVGRGFTLRRVFWITGLLAFLISPLADNLTTALLMGAVVMAVGGNNRKFVIVACINVVVAANAGGAFSPFGDITTLMVWQEEKVEFLEFFAIFLPSLVNWLIPAAIMSMTVSRERPSAMEQAVRVKVGGRRIILLFMLTITTAVCFHNFLNLPPAIGMMLGLGYLGVFSYYLKRLEGSLLSNGEQPLDIIGHESGASCSVETAAHGHGHGDARCFDLFRKIARAEWDTLLFFYGVVLCVGGLGQFGYLAVASEFMYHDLGPITANVMVGVLSAIVDNIPVMYAVLTMEPTMSHGHWLLVTLTAGVGGSLLSIGSAAGVALMGSARGVYTFGNHLRWSWAVGIGYAASILCHLWLNARHF